MAILKVARMGHPILRRIATPVDPKEIPTPAFQQFIQDMIETMREYNGLGLAAPQVHKSMRVSVVEVEENPRYKNKKLSGLNVFINPQIEYLTQDTNAYWEGCLSVPGLRGLVARPNRIKVKYLDENGASREVVADGFLATVLQHEFDHLDGKLYIDRLVDTTKLSYEEEFDKHWLPAVGEEAVADD
jgi:peptide deformylase